MLTGNTNQTQKRIKMDQLQYVSNFRLILIKMNVFIIQSLWGWGGVMVSFYKVRLSAVTLYLIFSIEEEKRKYWRSEQTKERTERKGEETGDVRAILVTNDLPLSLYTCSKGCWWWGRGTLDSGYYHFKASLES